MQPRRVIFPDTSEWIRTVLAVFELPMPAQRRNIGAQIAIRNDSGPSTSWGTHKTERYGVSVLHPDEAEANQIAREAMARLASARLDGPVASVTPGGGPFEVIDEEDHIEGLAHYYFTVELLVRGSTY